MNDASGLHPGEWIAIVNIIVTVAAVIAAPIIALWVAGKLQRRAEVSNAKLRLFGTLISLRHAPLDDEHLKALNLIDAVFLDDYAVREAWSRYYTVLNDNNLNQPVGWSIREERRRELLLAMVNSLSWGGKISSVDLLRTYIPTGAFEITYAAQLERIHNIAVYREKLAKMNIADPAPEYRPAIAVPANTPPPTPQPPTSPAQPAQPEQRSGQGNGAG